MEFKDRTWLHSNDTQAQTRETLVAKIPGRKTSDDNNKQKPKKASRDSTEHLTVFERALFDRTFCTRFKNFFLKNTIDFWAEEISKMGGRWRRKIPCSKNSRVRFVASFRSSSTDVKFVGKLQPRNCAFPRRVATDCWSRLPCEENGRQGMFAKKYLFGARQGVGNSLWNRAVRRILIRVWRPNDLNILTNDPSS